MEKRHIEKLLAKTGGCCKRPETKKTHRCIAMEVLEEVLEVWDRTNLIQWHPKSDKEGLVVIDNETGQFVMEMTNAIQKEPMTGKVEKNRTKSEQTEEKKGQSYRTDN